MNAHPVNEPILSYSIGSNERTSILEEIDKQMSEVLENHRCKIDIFKTLAKIEFRIKQLVT